MYAVCGTQVKLSHQTFSKGTNKPCRIKLLVFGPTTIDISDQSMPSLCLSKSYFFFLTWFGGSKGPRLLGTMRVFVHVCKPLRGSSGWFLCHRISRVCITDEAIGF